MTKKQYTSPNMEIYEFQMRQKLLFGSDIEKISVEGLLDNEIEQDDLPGDKQSIWDEAW
jgi:hypothetical protein